MFLHGSLSLSFSIALHSASRRWRISWRKSISATTMASLREKEYPVITKAIVPYFHHDQGLNVRGFIPRIRETEKNYLPKIIANEADCIRRWGKKTHGGFKFNRRGWSGSPRMCRRIESLYRATHQRPLPSTRVVGIAFAREIIDEKKGYLVNWADFAFKQCHRGKYDIYNWKSKLPEGEGSSRVNREDDDLEGAEDDWNINRQYKSFPGHHVPEFDIRRDLNPKPDSVIDRPMYGKSQRLPSSSKRTNGSGRGNPSDVGARLGAEGTSADEDAPTASGH
ncbi:hypothetical protein M758_UG029700 [Ceratodon purpureus]|nr:hypothetical protein M758_UG029700 [Ceratodon purpureus]